MNVKNLGVKFLFVVVLVAMALLALYPPDKKLKPGIDLAGGHSLLYEIDTTGLEGTQLVNLAERIITQLRKRVDPNSQRNLVWRPVGNTRIEIQMPASTGKVREVRKASDDAIAQLLELNVPSRSVINATLQSTPAEERTAALTAFNKGVESRNSLFAELADAYENYRKIRAGEVEPEGDENEVSAFNKYDQALTNVLNTSLSRARLVDVLDLGKGDKREEQFAKLKVRFPPYAAGLDDVIEKYDLWAKSRSLLEDPEDLKRLLRGAGVLEYRIMAKRNQSNPSRLEATEAAYALPLDDFVQQLQERGPRPKPGQPYQWFKLQDPVGFIKATDMEDFRNRFRGYTTVVIEEYADDYYALAYAVPDYTLLASSERKWKLTSARATRDFNTGKPIVQFELDPPGGDLFGDLTGRNVNKQLGMFLDNECMSSANIMSRIGRSGIIQGEFSQADVVYLVNTLEAGSLPARLKEPPLSERSIGSSLGQTNRSLGLKAAVGGLIVVAVFMLVYYLLCGLVANVALIMNVIFVLGAMAVLQATFTLPGIAGLILTLGMAVDANVLILERIREETRRGASLKMAIKNGYEKAFSTILDANVTTLITCVILGYAGSEEVKGFAIVLGLGVVFSMFTALFVTRIIFAALVQSGMVKSLPMLRLIGVPDVQWIGLRRIFWPVSVILVGSGAALFAFEHRNHKSNIYDIEFLGGTAVTIELQDGVTKSDEDVRMQINGQGPADADPNSAAGWLRFAADDIQSFEITKGTQAGVFEIRSQNLNAQQLEMVVKAGLTDDLEPAARGGVERIDSHAIRIAMKLDLQYDIAKLEEGLARSETYLKQAAAKLAGARVVVAWDSVEDRSEDPDTFDINTTETNKELVRQSIIAAMGSELKIQNPIEYVVRTDLRSAPQGYYPIHREDISPTELRLAHIIGGETLAAVDGFHGGVAIVFDELRPPQTEAELIDRLHSARLLPEFEQFAYRPFKIVGLETASEDSGLPAEQRRLSSIALLVTDENLVYEDDPVLWETDLASKELNHAKAALSSQKTLQKVNQFAPQIASQMTQQAIMAILLAMVAIVLYVWIRFGSMHFGLAAIVALVHDVTFSLGCVAISYYVFRAFGENILLIHDFKIDLPMVAALLTIVGYSLNDTIVVFDRIRENRGKMKEVTPQMVNASINQTLSRTVLTSTTTMLAVVVMYIWGGSGIHGFSFAMIIGVVVGTYSSVAIATPLLLHPNLLKWIINAIIAVVLVGLAWSMQQAETQILFWILAGLFGLAVLWNEIKRGGLGRPGLARGAA